MVRGTQRRYPKGPELRRADTHFGVNGISGRTHRLCRKKTSRARTALHGGRGKLSPCARPLQALQHGAERREGPGGEDNAASLSQALPPLFPVNKNRSTLCFLNNTQTQAPHLFCFLFSAACLKTPLRQRQSLHTVAAEAFYSWEGDWGILSESLVQECILSSECRMWLHAIKVSHRYFAVFWDVWKEDYYMGLGTPGYQSILPVGWRHPHLVINQSRSLHFSMWS